MFYIYGFNPYRMTLFNLIQKYKNNKLKSLNITGDLERDYLSIEKVSKIIIKLSLLKKYWNSKFMFWKIYKIKRFNKEIIKLRV